MTLTEMIVRVYLVHSLKLCSVLLIVAYPHYPNAGASVFFASLVTFVVLAKLKLVIIVSDRPSEVLQTTLSVLLLGAHFKSATIYRPPRIHTNIDSASSVGYAPYRYSHLSLSVNLR